MKKHNYFLAVLVLTTSLLYSCQNGDDDPEFLLCNGGSIKPFTCTSWGEHYGMLYKGESAPPWVPGFCAEKEATLWKDIESGYIVFEFFTRNADRWDHTHFYAEPVGPCEASIFWLQGCGTGYSVTGTLTLCPDMITFDINWECPWCIPDLYKNVSYYLNTVYPGDYPD